MYSEVISQQALDSLNKYFKTLESTGYMSYRNVYDLLGLLLVDSFLNTELSEFVTEEDYNIISKFLYCIYGRSCLIPYPQFIREIPQMGTIIPNYAGLQPFRITESSVYRSTENNLPRQTEYKTEFWG